MTDFNDLFKEEEERLLAKGRQEIAEEKARWDATSPDDKKAWLDQQESKWEKAQEAAMDATADDEREPCPGCGEPGCDLECDGEYD